MHSQSDSRATTYPFSAIVGQEAMKRSLLLHAVDPSLGGVIIFGERGTAKSTAVRSLAALLPPVAAVNGCAYRCKPASSSILCEECRSRVQGGETLQEERVPLPFVDLPLGATEDRILGTLDLEAAMTTGERKFQPGLLAQANRGFLYIDEVNLLADHLVDLLLDAAASGENIVEREGLSVRHPSRFVLVGSGNPEEGELRPQLLDRFALSVPVTTLSDVSSRIEVIRRRLQYSDDPELFHLSWQAEEARLATEIEKSQDRLGCVAVPDEMYELVARIGEAAHVDGHRAELATVRAARAHAALCGRAGVTREDVRRVAPLALAHRIHTESAPIREVHVHIEALLDEVIGRVEPSPAS